MPGWAWNEEVVTNKKCVLRIRYNTSSRDFDGWDLEKLAGTEFSVSSTVVRSQPEENKIE